MKKNRKRGARRTMAVTIRIALGGCALVAAGIGSLGVSEWVTAHPYFALEQVEVTGGEALGHDRILGAAGVSIGASLWRLDPGDIERRLESDPRIQHAEVVRELPDGLRIAIRERRPMAILALGNRRVFVGADGTLFDPELSEPLTGLPYVGGIGSRDIHDRPAWVGARLRELTRVLDLWGSRVDWPAISEVRHDGVGGVIVYPIGSSTSIRLGERPGTAALDRLDFVLERWRGKERDVALVDVSVPDQAILRLREPSSGSARGERV